MIQLNFHPWCNPASFEVELKPLDDRTHILRFTKDGCGKVFATREQLAVLREALSRYLAAEPAQ